MVQRNSNKAAPLLCSCKTYDDWCKMVRVWTIFSGLPPGWTTGLGKTQWYICSLPFLPPLFRTVKLTSTVLTRSNSIKQ